jgi:CHASE3 domain sensor protein
VVQPTVSLSEYQEAKAKLNESLFELHSLREEKKELENRVKQLELYNKIEMNKAAVERDYANTLKTQLEEASKVIEKKQYEILELQEDNMELSACLKRRLV